VGRNTIPKRALRYRPKGRRNIGGPRNRWRDQLHLTLHGHDDDDDGDNDDDDDDEVYVMGKLPAGVNRLQKYFLKLYLHSIGKQLPVAMLIPYGGNV
jgi:hypothetical protein